MKGMCENVQKCAKMCRNVQKCTDARSVRPFDPPTQHTEYQPLVWTSLSDVTNAKPRQSKKSLGEATSSLTPGGAQSAEPGDPTTSHRGSLGEAMLCKAPETISCKKANCANRTIIPPPKAVTLPTQPQHRASGTLSPAPSFSSDYTRRNRGKRLSKPGSRASGNTAAKSTKTFKLA